MSESASRRNVKLRGEPVRRSVPQPRTPVGFHTNWEGQLLAWVAQGSKREQIPHHWTTFSGVSRCAACGGRLTVPKSMPAPWNCPEHETLVQAALDKAKAKRGAEKPGEARVV